MNYLSNKRTTKKVMSYLLHQKIFEYVGLEWAENFFSLVMLNKFHTKKLLFTLGHAKYVFCYLFLKG